MKKNFLMFFLGALAMGAVLALVSTASNDSQQSINDSEINSINTEEYSSESFNLNSPVVVQSDVQFEQIDVQNWEIDNNLEIKNVDTGEQDVQYFEMNDDLELSVIDSK
jgi:hypothetical protein